MMDFLFSSKLEEKNPGLTIEKKFFEFLFGGFEQLNGETYKYETFLMVSFDNV